MAEEMIGVNNGGGGQGEVEGFGTEVMDDDFFVGWAKAVADGHVEGGFGCRCGVHVVEETKE
ncbi:hypothetical protein HanXRQr2_Chr09g0388081 [Helianthus annuus]|uniref:Uncharacterized protein n=1 Tax=Helianthus annuus TaxID=4232 RepID=A0A9K3I676_HELAN|nr:hypothetical protein HanXRQr2_Chr09g0388081 [Helianthus annuus]